VPLQARIEDTRRRSALEGIEALFPREVSFTFLNLGLQRDFSASWVGCFSVDDCVNFLL
jgi:hypothetical protein